MRVLAIALIAGALVLEEAPLARAEAGVRETPDLSRKPFSAGAFAGVGFPRPITVEAMARVQEFIGLGAEYSVLPALTISGVETSFWALAADARIFPFHNGFFIGVMAGHQHLSGSATTSSTGPAAITADTWFLNPRVGLLATTRFGLTLGADAGIQIPLSASIDDTVPVRTPAVDDARDIARLFGKKAIPTVNLLRVGFMF